MRKGKVKEMARSKRKQEGGEVRMVDVSAKCITQRTAEAAGKISMNKDAFQAILRGTVPKGDVFGAARVAGILAAKQTATLIPLCHPLILDYIDVTLALDDQGISANAEVKCIGRTGVEMEALTAVSVALLTVYDMCKAVDKQMQINDIHLVKKEKFDVENG